MKSTGIVRRIDDLGRIVIPKEIRSTFKIHEADPIEIFTDGDLIIFKKYSMGCIFCGSQENLELFRDKSVCPQCFKEIENRK
jgi:transcriptional pleiotropic regulator of transition state genes